MEIRFSANEQFVRFGIEIPMQNQNKNKNKLYDVSDGVCFNVRFSLGSAIFC